MGSQDKTKEHISLLFERPKEPVFMPKGQKDTVFDIPDNYWVDRYRPLQNQLTNRFGQGDHVDIKGIQLPDLSLPLSLDRQANFSLFIPYHRQLAKPLIDAFMNQRTLQDFLSLSVYVRDRANPLLYNYALSVAVLHRPDTRNIPVPQAFEIFPEKYMDSQVFSRAREEANLVPEGSRMPIIIPRDYSASDLDEEHRVAYFREDMGVNIHHWHWHLVYPFDGPREIVVKDRRGELFYYMHQQIQARYNFERFSNNLSRVKRILDLRQPIAEGYYPKLDSLVSSRVWPPRRANSILQDVNREQDQIKMDIQDLERWRSRIYEAIHTGSAIDSNGKAVLLDEMSGIDILGNMIEACRLLSVNSNYYGDLHNNGHILIAMCHDPDGRHLETNGVMGDPATDMRDPTFYRWHAFIDDIFQEHKNLLPRYTEEQLGYDGVRVKSAEVNSIGGQPKNLLITFWQQSDIDLSRGMDFTPRGNVFARVTHLQHLPFSYKIQVENSGQQRMGTCRIFLAPRFDERGLPFLFRDQKGMFIEMDKFAVNLRPGNNTIERQAKDSALIVPFQQTFRNLQANRPTDTLSLDEFNFCGCGWPEHMLVPKGTAAGMPCDLFIMISDIRGDTVDNKNNNPTGKSCKVSATPYCGLRDSKYPDRRHMGYPFDRLPRDGVNRLAEFLTPNMAVVDVTIKFQDRVVGPAKPKPNPQTG